MGLYHRFSTTAAASAAVDVAVIGAGVIGLAIARAFAMAGKEVIILEKGTSFGVETSSRHSEVIHAGLYYPPGSLKARLCVEGKHRLYEYLAQRSIPHQRTTKLVVATEEGQLPALHALRERARQNGVTDLELLSRGDAERLEPALRCSAALLSPSTGIFDSHAYMASLLADAEAAGATMAARSSVVAGRVLAGVHKVALTGSTPLRAAGTQPDLPQGDPSATQPSPQPHAAFSASPGSGSSPTSSCGLSTNSAEPKVASGPGAQPVLEDPATSSPNLAHELQSGSSSSTATSTGTSTSHSAGVPNASPSSSNTKSTAGAASGRGGGGGLELVVEDVSGGSGGESLRLTAGLVVNCAGLDAQRVSSLIQGVPPQSIPRQYLARGVYFTLANSREKGVRPAAPFSRLIYPLPPREGGGLGTHLTLDLGGGVRFGPDVEWVDRVDYSVDPGRAASFYPAIRSFWPGLPDGALAPGYAGIRPKVSGPGQPAADFIIQGPQQHGVPGYVALYGIESPGLTSSLAIAEYVRSLVLAS